jgi:hypothetical protein
MELSPFEFMNNPTIKRINPVPVGRTQAGPNCGFYALAYVLRYWEYRAAADGVNIGARALPARKKDDPQAGTSLRQLAKKHYAFSLTAVGELFSGDAMAAVVIAAGFDARVHRLHTDEYVPRVKTLIDLGYPPVVAFDVDGDATVGNGGVGHVLQNANFGGPGQYGGEHAHWAVAVGYTFWGYRLFFVIHHWNKFFWADAEVLRASANQLLRFSRQRWYKLDKWQMSPQERAARRGEFWQKVPGSEAPRDLWRPGSTAANYQRYSDPWLYQATVWQRPTLVKDFRDVDLDLRNQLVEVAPRGMLSRWS